MSLAELGGAALRSGEPATARAALRRFLRVPPADERMPDWHVGPFVDMAAYHFSWLWLLLPLLACGDRHPGDYFAGFAALMIVNFVHRHFTLPIVYLDREVFARHPLRFTLAPLALGAALLATPALERGALPADLLGSGSPAAPIPGTLLFAGVVFVAGAWNLWHVLAQKFGILRLYAAKARGAGAREVPRWVDRCFLLGPLPFLIVHLGTRHRESALAGFPEAGAWLEALLDALGRAEPWLWPGCAALAAASVALFFAAEWRVAGLRNGPRLSMGLGMLALSASFLLVNPVKVYMAYAFSHGVEYIVFVWAFQRRCYQGPRARRSWLGRLHAHPWRIYPAFGLGLAALYVLLENWGASRNPTALPRVEIAGAQIGLWVFYWTVYQSLLHFYYDGFLWKARRPEYRASL
jgi:hypothetical protein